MITDAELYPQSVPKPVKSLRIPQGARKQVVFQLMANDGSSQSLVQEVLTAPAEEPAFGTQKVVSPLSVTVRLRAIEPFSAAPIFDILGKVNPANPNVVIFLLDEASTGRPGIWAAEVGQFSGDYLVETWPVLISIEPSVFGQLCGEGPLTLAEIRLGLQDFSPDEASLLDDEEFSDVQIAHAIRRTVQLWNETPPPVCIYTPSNFPYRYHWTLGTIAYLLDTAAASYRRNRLAYNAGGISVDDQSKAAEYQQQADAKKAEFMLWMKSEKVRINMDAAWTII